MTVKTLVTNKDYTPQQVLVDLQNQIDDVDTLVLVFRRKRTGTIHVSHSQTSYERAITMFWCGVDHVMDKMKASRQLRDKGPAA